MFSWDKRRKERDEKAKESARAERDAQEHHEYAVTLNALVEEIRGYRSEQHRAEPKRLSIDKTAAVAAVIAAILSFGSLIAFVLLTLKTDSTAQKAVGVSGQQLAEMKTEQRPWISVSAFQPSMVVDTSGIGINIVYTVHNSGHLPAVGGLAGTSIFVALGPKSFGEPLNSRATCRKSEVATGFSIFPGDSPVLQTAVQIPQSWIDSAPANQKLGNAKILPIFVGFCLVYKELGPNGRYHHTPYWLRLADLSLGNPGSLVFTGNAVPADKLKLLQLPVIDIMPD